MAKISASTTLRVEDFDSEQRKWLPRLFTPLNLFLTSVTNVVNGRIEFGSNIPSIDFPLNFTYSGTPQKFTWGNNLTPKVLWIGQAFEDNAALALAPIWSYDASIKTVTVDFAKISTGGALVVGSKYQVFVRVAP